MLRNLDSQHLAIMRLNALSWGRILITSSLLLSSVVLGKKDGPKITAKDFEFVPRDVTYFEDSDVILFADAYERNMYRSDDAGETWSIVDGPTKGSLIEMVVHPFDHTRAYYIGDSLRHWATTDRGKSWQEFKVDMPASEWRAAMSFHAGDPDRIIFSAMDDSSLFFSDEMVCCFDLGFCGT